MSTKKPSARLRAQLQTRLQAAGHWDAETTASQANPLPVALPALYRLGASDARLAAFTAAFHADFTAGPAPRLHPAPAIEAWPAGDPWRERFGDPLAWPVYRHLFRQWLAHEGAGDVLQQALPYLIPGCGAGAFHGLVRVAHAFEAVAPGALADGLAYWACRWLDLGATPAPVAGAATLRDPARLLGDLSALPRSNAGLITHRMAAAARAPGFDAVVARLQIDDDTLARLSRLAAQRYARTGSFTLLQLVASAPALRVLLPLVDDGHAAVAAYWRACAASLAAAADEQPGRAAPLLDWAELVQAAVASNDGHLAKLVDACRQEQNQHGGAADWQQAASRAVADARQRGGSTRVPGQPDC